MSGAPKAKTKAKTRYLRAKKERRKQRKAVEKPVTEDAGDSGLVEPVVAHGQSPVNVKVKRKKLVVEDDGIAQAQEELLRKKRKLESPQVEGDSLSDAESSASEARQEDPSSPGSALAPSLSRSSSPALSTPGGPLRPRAVTPSQPLQYFPRPTQPAPPDPSVLALQGLDRALLSAESVDASKVLHVDSEDVPLGLSDRMKKRLKDLGIMELFAVQTALLPYLLTSRDARLDLYCPYYPPRDICVSAPTGSGKTLAYVVPIVEILTKRIVTRLRALVILPTRDLVVQVRETFEAMCKGSGLKIATATGQHSFAHEQNQLIADLTNKLQGGSSKIDILICTPGRLIDHLSSTPNFTLQHLRFLVIDEADRLLSQSFQEWLPRVLVAIQPPPEGLSGISVDNYGMPMPDSVAPAWQARPRSELDRKRHPSCQKLLFSATLTRDPSKTAALRLRDPKYFIVMSLSEGESGGIGIAKEQFAMPTSLKEHYIVCSSDVKPLHLFHLVHSQGVTNALVFTKSADSTTRLLQLFDFFEASWAAEEAGRQPVLVKAYSSDLNPSERKSILEQFREGAVSILVASDLISRGIDISHVSHVVNYDAPVDMRKYVHRAGRTARAGRGGDAWSLVEEQEARFFKGMLTSADHLKRVKRMRVSDQALAPLTHHYEAALRKLKEVYGKRHA